MTMLPSGTSTLLPSMVISTIACPDLQIFRHHAALVLDVVCELVAEMLDEATHWHGCRVAQGTNGAAHDVGSDRVKHLKVLGSALAVFNTMDHAIQPAGSLAA